MWPYWSHRFHSLHSLWKNKKKYCSRWGTYQLVISYQQSPRQPDWIKIQAYQREATWRCCIFSNQAQSFLNLQTHWITLEKWYVWYKFSPFGWKGPDKFTMFSIPTVHLLGEKYFTNSLHPVSWSAYIQVTDSKWLTVKLILLLIGLETLARMEQNTA